MDSLTEPLWLILALGSKKNKTKRETLSCHFLRNHGSKDPLADVVSPAYLKKHVHHLIQYILWKYGNLDTELSSHLGHISMINLVSHYPHYVRSKASYLVTVNPFPKRISMSKKIRKLTEKNNFPGERERATKSYTGDHK